MQLLCLFPDTLLSTGEGRLCDESRKMLPTSNTFAAILFAAEQEVE
jgi:hypothetical protein